MKGNLINKNHENKGLGESSCNALNHMHSISSNNIMRWFNIFPHIVIAVNKSQRMLGLVL